MKYDEFHDLVRKNGWMVLRQSGSHVIYQKGKELGRGLERKIIKEMNLR